MKKVTTPLLHITMAALLVFTVSACSINVGGDSSAWQDKRSETAKLEEQMRTQISTLTLGTAIADVRTQLGAPDFTESYNKAHETVVVLFYRTHRTEADGMTTKDECTPLVFRNGVLTGWGESAVAETK